MARWHVWGVILLGVGLLTWGLLAQLGVGPTDIGETIGDRTKEVLGPGGGSSLVRNVTVSGTFIPTKLELGEIPVRLLALEYEPGASDLTVNDVRVAADEKAKVAIEQYQGRLTLDGNRVTFDGTAKRVRVNGVVLDTGTTTVKVKSSGLAVTQFEAIDADVRRFKASLRGTLAIQDSVVVSLNSEPLEMDAFLGKLKIADSLTFDGKARRVFVLGQDYRTTVS